MDNICRVMSTGKRNSGSARSGAKLVLSVMG